MDTAPMGRLTKIAITFALAILSVAITANAQTSDHQLIRRLAVFPFAVPHELTPAADEAWWQAREEFASTHRFLVGSKQFLIKTDVYQPRRDLEPADAIILGKLLDAHALVTFQMIERRLMMTVYDGGNGSTIWRKGVSLHPSLPVSDQLPQVAKRMVDDFVASIPYQGFTVVDSLIGQSVYEEGDVKLAQVDLGLTTGSQVGDVVQWIRVSGTSVEPLFAGGSKVVVFAEGKIVKIEQGIAVVEIQRASSIKDLKEFSLVRVPREADRLAKAYAIRDNPRTTLTAELVAPEAAPMEQLAKERKPLATTLSIISSIAAFLLLAF
jgi:hypothetical protein